MEPRKTRELKDKFDGRDSGGYLCDLGLLANLKPAGIFTIIIILLCLLISVLFVCLSVYLFSETMGPFVRVCHLFSYMGKLV